MNRVELAKAAGWRIECLGDQQDGLWNWVIFSPAGGYCIQTEYPLANEGEAWDYFYGVIVGLPAQPAPSAPAPTVAEGERARIEDTRAIFHDVIEGHLTSTPEVMAQRGLFVLEQYDLQHVAHKVNAERGNDFEAQNEALEAQLQAAQALAATNARLLDNAQHELEVVRGELASAQEWARITETNWHDCGKALAAMLKDRGISEMTIGGYYIYEALGETADAFPVDDKGQRIHASTLPTGGGE